MPLDDIQCDLFSSERLCVSVLVEYTIPVTELPTPSQGTVRGRELGHTSLYRKCIDLCP